MELILTENVEKVGRKGDVVRVRDGFARNFLIPRSLAVPSTRANQEFVSEQKVRAEKRREKERAEAQKAAEKVGKVKLTIEAASGEKDKLFGSVTAEDISEALKKQGHSFDKKHIQLKDAIRALGTYSVAIEVYPQVKANISVEVIKKS
jgi:large subunit ribosomal protein L9